MIDVGTNASLREATSAQLFDDDAHRTGRRLGGIWIVPQ